MCPRVDSTGSSRFRSLRRAQRGESSSAPSLLCLAPAALWVLDERDHLVDGPTGALASSLPGAVTATMGRELFGAARREDAAEAFARAAAVGEGSFEASVGERTLLVTLAAAEACDPRPVVGFAVDVSIY